MTFLLILAALTALLYSLCLVGGFVALVATGCEVSRLAALIRLKQQGWVVAAASSAACPRESGGGG